MGIVSELYKAKQRDFSERLREMTDPRVVYVTDLVSCSYKRVMRLQFPLLSFRFEPSLVLGDLVHAGLGSLLASRGWETEVPIERKYIIDGEEYILKGRIDLLKRNDDGKPHTIVEIKTSRELPENSPREHHIMQLRIYMELTGAKRGYLLYVTPDRLVEFEVEPSSVDVEALLRETIYNLRAPRYDWECRYCSYRKICPFARLGRHS
ncbi:CRISPR-associated protein Cas4 [Pyrodictium occultum]|uniref:CRISPR-associated exonuclease Cas4 n=1 Tax=Pyrodictium occultum TaxID=2309 RepID=A0A0V8RV31_PYROC|nr:CRISPR-associated protein Cas4 [Pyrodictium occultum]KSW11908.1 CRISPR-associated protein Cas4 [Pyrodictium occultum]